MYDRTWLKLLQQQRVIAVIRARELEIARQMALAVAAGGISSIEITWNSDRAPDLIAELRDRLPRCTIGTGTLLSKEQMQQAIAAGAQFLFTPHVDPTLIQTATNAGIPIVPGAMTPTEIVTAHQAGANCVKVFPIQAVGGANYIRSLQGPLGHISLIPTGGVTLENVTELLNAGAIAVGLAGDLFPQKLMEARDWEAISQRSRNLIQQLPNNAIA